MIRLVSLADLVDLYAARGSELYGEDVTQVAHAEQTAAHVAAAGGSIDLIAAALVHDVGHLLAGAEDGTHEIVGATALATLFPASVRRPVALHVAAKRYLCATDPAYFATLSAASRRSLARQGGAFAADEAARFAGLPGAAAAIALRQADDAGKQPGGAVPAFASYLPLLARLARSPARRAP